MGGEIVGQEERGEGMRLPQLDREERGEGMGLPMPKRDKSFLCSLVGVQRSELSRVKGEGQIEVGVEVRDEGEGWVG